MSVGLLSLGYPGQWPGQPGNPVGYSATTVNAPSGALKWGNAVWGTWADGSIFTATWPGAYPGALTAWPGGTGSQTISSGANATSGSGTKSNPYVFANYDFNAGTGQTTINLQYAVFVGCRFQGNAYNGGSNVVVSSAYVFFEFCSFVPLVSLYTSPPQVSGYGSWPSAGAGTPTINVTSGTYGITYTNATQVGISSNAGPLTCDHCDFWGQGGRAVSFVSGSNFDQVFQDCWIHDCANGGPGNFFHNDGFGYEVGGLPGTTSPPSNITINHCTGAFLGNDNIIAFQQGANAWASGTTYSTGNVVGGSDNNAYASLTNSNVGNNPVTDGGVHWQLVGVNYYENITVKNCYFSGANYLIDICHGLTGNRNITFTDNVISTIIGWNFGPIYINFDTTFNGTNGNLWSNNSLSVFPGTSSSSGFMYGSANNGNYIWPDSTLSTTDWSNT